MPNDPLQPNPQDNMLEAGLILQQQGNGSLDDIAKLNEAGVLATSQVRDAVTDNGKLAEASVVLQKKMLDAQERGTEEIKQATRHPLPPTAEQAAAAFFGMLRGPQGYEGPEPSDERLIDLINPLIPVVEDGHTPTTEELQTLMRPLIPDVQDGHTPTNEELRALMRPLIPKVKTPEKSKDFLTPKDISELTEDISDAVISRIPTPKPFTLTGAKTRDALTALRGDSRLSINALKGVDTYFDGKSENWWKMAGAKTFLMLEDTPIAYEALKFVRVNADETGLEFVSLADLLIAGINITLTENPDGTVTINSTAIGTGILDATGTINDANLSFTFTQLPSVIIINGGTYRQTGGAITWSWNAGTLTATLSSAVGTGGSIFGLT